MDFDVGNKQDRDRLHRAIKTSRDHFDTNFRRKRTAMIRQFVGTWYSRRGARDEVYVNRLNQSARIYTMALAFNNPQVQVNSWVQELRPFCRRYEVNINRVIENIDFKTSFAAGVLDAFFFMGIYKVRMADAGYSKIADNVWIDVGKPWMDRISPDDTILDLSARDIRAMRFIGDRYRASWRKVQERDDFEAKVVAGMTPTSKFTYDSGSDYASQIASGYAVDDDELEPMIWLEDVYLPETRQLVTFAADNPDLPPLKVQDEDEGPMGPYETLSLGFVPDNIIPCSPAANLMGLHLLHNSLYRKLAEQAEQQKNTVGYAAGGEDDALRGKNAKNGEFFLMRDPKSMTPVAFPGVDGNLHAFYLASQEVYNTQAGNERAIAGLGREADTYGQEKMIHASATSMMAEMKGAVNQCAGRLARKIGALMWDDDALAIESSMEAEHTGYYVPSHWSPGHRQGIKDQYLFSVEQNSMGFQPPELKFEKVMAYIQQLGTALPLVQAGLLDIQELTTFAAKCLNSPDLERMFKFMAQDVIQGADQHQATKAPVTSRETVRNNRSSGPSEAGMGQVWGQMMQGRSSQSPGVSVGAR